MHPPCAGLHPDGLVGHVAERSPRVCVSRWSSPCPRERHRHRRPWHPWSCCTPPRAWSMSSSPARRPIRSRVITWVRLVINGSGPITRPGLSTLSTAFGPAPRQRLQAVRKTAGSISSPRSTTTDVPRPDTSTNPVTLFLSGIRSGAAPCGAVTNDALQTALIGVAGRGPRQRSGPGRLGSTRTLRSGCCPDPCACRA